MTSRPPYYWLAVESYDNWRADQRAGFKHYGVAPAKRRLASTIRKGDLVIMYVSSGRSCLADARIVTADGIRQTGENGYDRPFPDAIQTTPSIVLPEPRWVDFRNVASQLQFVSAAANWRPFLRNSLRALSEVDGLFLLRALQKRAT